MATIICDIDGTLLRSGVAPIRKTIDFINEQSKNNRIVLVTGRPDSQRSQTVVSLRRAGVKYNALKMAPNTANTHSKRIEFKRSVGESLKGEASLAIDNDADARAAYASAGIPTKSPGSLPEVKKWAGSAFDPKGVSIELEKADINLTPTDGMKSAAARALAWHKDGKRGGTIVGLTRANQIVNGENLSESTVARMYSFFSRREVDKKATGFSAGEEGYPSPGRVAWDLWGGDAGFSWSRSKWNQIKNMKKWAGSPFDIN